MDNEEEVLQKFRAVNPIRIAGNINSIANAIDNIRRLKNFLVRKSDDASEKNQVSHKKCDNNIESVNKSRVDFSGQHTDIAYASIFDNGLPTEYISRIENDILRRNVKESFSDAVHDGYLKLDNGKYQLTDNGKEHINSPEFIKRFENDQKYMLIDQESKAVFKLKGEPQDVEVFRYAESINIGADNLYGDKSSTNDVTAYFEKLERKGFVTVDKDNNVKPTEKTQQYLNEHYPQKVDIKLITTGNVEDLAKASSAVNMPPGVSQNGMLGNPVNTTADAAKATEGAAATEAGKTAAKTASSAAGTVTIVITVANAALKKLKQQNNNRKVNHTNSRQR